MTTKLITREDIKGIDFKSGAYLKAYTEANIENFDRLVKVEYIPKGLEGNEQPIVRLICRDCGKTYTADNFGPSLKAKVSHMFNHFLYTHDIHQGNLTTRFITYPHICNNFENYNISD